MSFFIVYAARRFGSLLKNTSSVIVIPGERGNPGFQTLDARPRFRGGMLSSCGHDGMGITTGFQQPC
jgi:hypothetical protein